MHDVIENGMEDYLSGNASRDFHAHLKTCPACRTEVAEFAAVSNLMGALKPLPDEEMVLPLPGFYARLSQTVEARKANISPWNIFSVDAAFGRRLAFGSLMTLALLGGFLVSRESDYTPGQPAGVEAIMASHDSSAAHESGADRDRMMAALTTYEH